MSIIDNTYSFCRLVSIATSSEMSRAKRRRRTALWVRRNLYRRAVGAARHQAIFKLGLRPEIADQHDPGDRQRQHDDQAHQRGRSAVVGLAIVVLEALAHRPPEDIAETKLPLVPAPKARTRPRGGRL